MHARSVIVPSDDPRVRELTAEGWTVAARSWGAGLRAADVDRARLGALIRRAGPCLAMRELGPVDHAAILALDAATLGDYVGGPATRHTALTAESARVRTATRRAFGAFDADGALIAMTFVDVDPETSAVETDFTVVAAERRGQGIGTALKAACVLALLDGGAESFRTGGSSENAGSIAANTALGYRMDEEWLTLERPAGA